MSVQKRLMIHIFLCGGTFDKVYDPLAQALVLDVEQSSVGPILVDSKMSGYTIHRVVCKDSLDMTDGDRAALWDALNAHADSPCVVVHGTDRLLDSARWSPRDSYPNTIVFTGSIVPHSLRHSDAAFNLGAAVVAAQTLAKGVWLVMHGRVFSPWLSVAKRGDRFEYS